jgi:regulator of protease activity HflC (stomatin/prohibitin superfamily)
MADLWGLLLALILGAIPFLFVAGIILFFVFLGGIKIIKEYQRGVKFRLGRYNGIMTPGINYVIPFLETWVRLDTRVFTIDIPGQDVITKDNIPVNINAVVYYKVKNPEKAVMAVMDYNYAISKYSQTSLRNLSGEATLDELLSKREEIAKKLAEIVDVATDPWGLDVTMIELQDINLPSDLKRTMAKQAEAEREKRAIIIKALGELEASKNISDAARKLAKSPGSLYLRTLETINHLSPEESHTNVYAIPIEVLKAFEKYSEASK